MVRGVNKRNAARVNEMRESAGTEIGTLRRSAEDEGG